MEEDSLAGGAFSSGGGGGGGAGLGQSLGWEARPPSDFFPGLVLTHWSVGRRDAGTQGGPSAIEAVFVRRTGGPGSTGRVLHPCLGPGHTPTAPTALGSTLPQRQAFTRRTPISCLCSHLKASGSAAHAHRCPQVPTGKSLCHMSEHLLCALSYEEMVNGVPGRSAPPLHTGPGHGLHPPSPAYVKGSSLSSKHCLGRTHSWCSVRTSWSVASPYP